MSYFNTSSGIYTTFDSITYEIKSTPEHIPPTRFVKVGFEFTAAKKLKGKLTNDNLETDSKYENIYKRHWDEKVSKFQWINRRFESDSCGIEVSTPIIKKDEDVARYFNEFKQFVDDSNLTLDINEAPCTLGGCHIHMSLPKDRKEMFLRNIGIFMTNYPELNWGFNDVNDNENANSLLCLSPYKGKKRTEDLVTHGGIYSPKANNRLIKRALKTTPAITFFLISPLTIVVNKRYAIRYNIDYDTVEFRIFDMPSTLERHLLHYEVAKGIYEYCLKQTMQMNVIPLDYCDLKDYNFTLSKSLRKFNECMVKIGIDPDRCDEMRSNIRTRYRWDKADKHEHYLV